ncbi:MAG TPA: TolC family protein [Phycisphaerae bacterium]|nr:TolC family protein [Phycisphaerae bacterium]
MQDAVRERIGQRIIWNQATDADAAATESVRELLTLDLSADQCVQVALLNNRRLQATYEELGVAQADLVKAGLLQNPVFIGQVRFPARPATPFEADVVLNFLDIFILPLRKRAAEAEFERVKSRVASTVVEHAAQVRCAFYTLQGAKQLRELRATAAQATEASAELASRQFQAGNISELDRSNEQALREQTMAELSLSEGEVRTLRERLNGFMGLWGEDADRWQIAGRLPDLPEPELSPDDLESLAVSQRLELSQARQEIEAVAQSLGLARLRRAAGGVTQLDIGGHYEREPEGIGTAGPSLEITLPLFNQGQPALARAEAMWRQSQQHFAALSAQIRSEVRVAKESMFAARRLAERYQQITLPLRERIVQESQLHYNAMQIGPIQLLQARQAQLDAGRQYIESLRNYWVSRAELERVVGGRLPTSSPTMQPTGTEPSGQQSHEPERQTQEHGHGGH